MEDQYTGTPRVVELIDDLKFVINRGSRDGIKVGANFLVFGLGEQIVDPDSGEELGILELVRGRARAVHVQDRISTLRSSETKTTPGKVRKVLRQSRVAFGFPTEEEIEEGRETTMVSLNAQVGDFARLV